MTAPAAMPGGFDSTPSEKLTVASGKSQPLPPAQYLANSQTPRVTKASIAGSGRNELSIMIAAGISA